MSTPWLGISRVFSFEMDGVGAESLKLCLLLPPATLWNGYMPNPTQELVSQIEERRKKKEN